MDTQANGGPPLGVEALVEFLGILFQLRLRLPRWSRHRRYRLPQGRHTLLGLPPPLRREEVPEHRLHALDLGIQLREELLLQNK